MNGPAGFFVIGGIFAALVIYFYIGGVGGLLGKAESRRSLRAASRATAAPAPRAALGSIASSPGSAAGAGFSRGSALEQVEQIFKNDLTPFEVHMADLSDIVPPALVRRMAAGFVQQLASSEIPEAQEEPVSAWFKQNSRDFLANAAVGAIGGAVMRRTLREFSESERNALRLAHILEALGVLSSRERLMLAVPLIWNDGDCALQPGGAAFHAADRRARLR